MARSAARGGQVEAEIRTELGGRRQGDATLAAEEAIEHWLRHAGVLGNPVLGQPAVGNRLEKFVDDVRSHGHTSLLIFLHHATRYAYVKRHGSKAVSFGNAHVH